jgi:hypothetical protein
VGCGSSNTVQISGKVLKDGSAYRPPDGQKLGVTLYSVGAKDARGRSVASEPYPALFNGDDGTFTVPGPDGRGIPRGSYRVALIQKPTREAIKAAKPKKGEAADREADAFGGKFGSETSPIVREVTSDQELVIDLAKPGS